MTTTAHRSLADQLRSWSDTELAKLLQARPDLAIPVPGDVSVLAQRAHTRMSVARALEHLDRFQLEILDAVRVAAAGDREATRAAVLAVVGDGAPEHSARRALERLAELALLWPDGDTLRLVGSIEEVGSPYPAGLGRPIGSVVAGHTSAELAPVLSALHLPDARQPEASAVLADALADPVRLRALIDRAPAEAKSVLDRLAAGPPIGTVKDARRSVPAEHADTPVRWLIAHGLLVAVGEDTVELPREVGLLVRGSTPLGPLHPIPPAMTARSVSRVDDTGAGQVLEMLRWTEALLEACAAEPAGVLRSGGMGVRELRRLARSAGVDEPIAALLLEVAHSAALLDQSSDVDAEWLPTPSYDGWRNDPLERRWVRLARSWIAMTRMPVLIGQRDDRDRLVSVLSPDVERAGAGAVRQLALGVLAELPRGSAASNADILELLAWRSPRRGGRGREAAVNGALTEAGLLGITARGALTSYGPVLLAGDDPAAMLKKFLPAPVDHVLVQADLTVVAPGPLEPFLAGELDLVADIESAGGATVYRVTPSSVRRALDAGRSAADLHRLFAGSSRTPVPQTLSYLIDDVARRHGGLRTGAAGSYLRSDDQALLAEILADRRCEMLRFHQLAATVLVSPVAPNRLLDGLREAGYTPVPEDAGGVVLLSRPDARRAPGRARVVRPGADLPAFDNAYLTEAVRMLRRGDDAATEARRSPVITRPVATDSATTLSVLQRAAKAGHRVWLGYVDAHGAVTARVIRPISVGGGYLRADDDRTDILHTFALHRITSAVLADDK